MLGFSIEFKIKIKISNFRKAATYFDPIRENEHFIWLKVSPDFHYFRHLRSEILSCIMGVSFLIVILLGLLICKSNMIDVWPTEIPQNITVFQHSIK